MYNYLSSYFGGSAEEEAKNEETKLTNFDGETVNQPNQEAQQEGTPSNAGGGLLASLKTKVSGHPSCEIVLTFNKDRKYFTAGDDLRGRILIKTAVEGQTIQHQGIKVSLYGMAL